MSESIEIFARTTMGVAKDVSTGEPRSLSEQQLRRVVEYLRSSESGVGPYSSFEDFVATKLRDHPPSLAPGSDYVGFSGVDSSNVSNFENAREFVRARSGQAGIIGSTPWGEYLDSQEGKAEVRQMAQKFERFLSDQNIEPFNRNYAGALTDVMWNAGSPEYFRNAVQSGRPVVAFVENAPKNRGFSNFELPVALEYPDTVVNGYPMRAFGSGDDALAFASRSAAEYQALERSIAEAATRNSGREVSVAEVRKNLDLADGYNASSKTVFDVPRASFEQLNFDLMKSTADEWSETRVAARSTRIATALEPEVRAPALEAHPSTGPPTANATETPARFSSALEVDSPRLGKAGVAALGGAALAVAAYDAKQTGDRISTAFAQDNPVAARSEAEQFLARTGGGAAAVFTPIAFGATGGPALALLAVDAYLLTEGFDRVAERLQLSKVVNQTVDDIDWTLTGRQWVRKDLRTDLIDDGVDQSNKGRLSAPLDLVPKLNFLASIEATSQAMGDTTSRKPFELSANVSDARSNMPRAWNYDTQSGQWTRTRLEEIDPTDPRLPDLVVIETASPKRAVELNNEAALIIERNVKEGSAPLAMQFEIAYRRNGWDRFGPEPPAVLTALNPDTLEASDGHQYARNARGQWSHGGDVASDNIALELEATRGRLIPALERHEANLAKIPAWQPPTPEQFDREKLRQLYTDFNVDPSQEQFEVAYEAVQRTRKAEGINPATSSLGLAPNSADHYYVGTSILHLRTDTDGVVRAVATTTVDVIPPKETALSGALLAIDPPSVREREVQAQAQREANRTGVSQDETQAAVRVSAPGVRNGRTSNQDQELLDEAPPKRHGQETPPTTASVPPNFAPSQQALRDLRDPQHEGYDALCEMQHRAKLFETQNSIPHGPHSNQLGASMLAFAVENRFRYNNVYLEKNQDTGQVQLKHARYGEPTQYFDADLAKMSSQPIEVSSQRINEAVSKHNANPASALERTQEQTQGLGELSPDMKVMFGRVRGGTPGHISDDHVMLATLEAKKAGMDANTIEHVSMVRDQIRVVRSGPDEKTVLVDVNSPAPPLQASVQEANTINQQQVPAQQQALSQQQSQNPQPDGPSGPTIGPRTM